MRDCRYAWKYAGNASRFRLCIVFLVGLVDIISSTYQQLPIYQTMNESASPQCLSPGLLLVEADSEFSDWAEVELARLMPKMTVLVQRTLAGARQWLADPASAYLQLAVVDLRLGDGAGVDLIEDLNRLRPGLPVLVVTSVVDPSDVLRAFRLGAQGYLLKSSIKSEFLRGIRQALDGGSPIDPEIANVLLSAFRQTDAPPPRVPAHCADVLSRLSSREAEVLQVFLRGYTYKEIARMLAVAPCTVDTHVRSIFRKLHVNSRVALRRLLTSEDHAPASLRVAGYAFDGS